MVSDRLLPRHPRALSASCSETCPQAGTAFGGSHRSAPRARLSPTVGPVQYGRRRNEKEEETSVQPTRASRKLQASASLRGQVCSPDQLHAEGSLKIFSMLNLVN